MGVSAEAKETLATLRDLRFAASPSERVGALQSAASFVSENKDTPAPVLKAVLQLVTPTARRYRDRTPRLAALELIDACLGAQPEVAVSALAALLAGATAELGSLPTTGLGVASTLLDWVVSALGCAATALPESAKDEWGCLTTAASVCLVCLSAGSKRVSDRATRTFQGLLAKCPAVADKLAATLARGPLVAVHCGVASQLALRAGAGGAAAHGSLQKVALDLLTKHVLPGPKSATPRQILSGSEALISSAHTIDHDAFKATLLPALLRSTKRNLTAALPVVNWVLETTRLDLSAYSGDIGGLLAEHVRHKDEAVRELAVTATALFARRCSNSEAVESTFDRLHSLLVNKAEKVTQSDCRIAVYRALAALGNAQLSASAMAEFVSAAARKLLTTYPKEAVEVTSLAGADAAASLAGRCGQKAHCKELVDAAVAALGDAKATVPLKVAMLECLLASFQGDHAAEAAAACPAVVKAFRAAKGASASAVKHLAATLLLRVACAAPEATRDTVDAKFAARLLDDRASTDKFFRLDGTAEAQVELAELALQNANVAAVAAGGSGDGLYEGVITLLTHPSAEVRRLARRRVPVLLRNNATLAVRLRVADAFEAHLRQRAESGAAAAASAAESAVLAEAFAAIAVLDGPNRGWLAARLLVPGHHPLLGRLDCWSKAVRWSRGADQAEWVADDDAPALANALRGSMAAGDVESACRAAGVLARRSDSEAVIDAVATRLLDDVRDGDMVAVTAHEVDVLNTPDGTLCSEHNKEDDEMAALNPNSKDYEEKLWEIKVRRELAKKKGQDRPAKKLTKQEIDKRKAKLEEEAAVRQRVAALKSKGEAALRVAVELAGARESFSALRIACVVPVLYTLAMSPLLGGAAHDALLAFGRVIDPRLRYVSEAVVHAVLRASEVPGAVPTAWMRSDLHELVAKTMRRLWAVTHDAEPLDVPSFGFCWPLLQHILMRSSLPGAVLEDALVFMTGHVDLGSSPLAPRRGVLMLLAHVATNHERLALQATTYLRAFVASMLGGDDDGGDGGGEGAEPVGDAEVGILTESAMSANADLRRAAAECLQMIGRVQPVDAVVSCTWLAKHDSDASIAEATAAFWDEQGYEMPAGIVDFLLAALRSLDKEVRASGARAVAAAVEADPSRSEAVMSALLEAFEATLVAPEVVTDHLGNPVEDEHVDEWFFRCGIAQTWEAAAPLWPGESVERLFVFLVEVALVSDRDARSQEAVMTAGAALIDEIAKSGSCDGVLQIVNAALEGQRGVQDTMRQSLVVLLGSVAKHLDPGDPRIPEVIDQLLATLSTPSETVQEAVGNCISPLIKAVKPRAPAILDRLFDQLLEDPKFGVRRGAAYGIAGVVKGLGILALKQHGLTDKLKEAVSDKKNARHREGALMAYELLCVRVGRLFEPYIINILPDLLVCYGDGSKDVRLAAQETAQAIMAKLSSHGVKLVLPVLLEAIESHSWRTKLGSVELLGAMAFMAPKQLAACLPTIVPRIQEVLSDAHDKVQTAGRAALERIGGVIKNPEIQAIVPTILMALDDPHKHSEKCLRLLLETAFVHVIDAPSLALIMPVLKRALGDRSTKLKKSATQIIGNMYTLTDPADLAPYLPALLPGVQEALLDPEPSVRGIASKALGSIVKGMGEDSFPELMPWLFDTLRSETNSVDRSGAAQGISEVLRALGNDRLEAMLDDFVTGTQHPNASVREGYLMLFVYLPVSFKDDFVRYVGRIIPCLLRGLSDVEDGVRSTAMRAAVGVITHFSQTSVELLLPELEAGLVDESWRIRESSVKLLGELMYLLSGVTGKQSTLGGEDESFGTEESDKTIIEALGQDRRDRVLAGVFLARQDVSVHVRQAATQVWKVVVPHTVRTLRDVLPSLITLLLASLGDESADRRLTAARTLSEVLRKLGERILPQVFPILESNSSSAEAATRHGVCVALSEILKTCSADQLEEYVPVLVRTVKRSLIDPEEEVRAAASQVFAGLHSVVGPQIVEEVVEPLLAEVQHDENALDGLRQMIGSKGSFILPLVVPRLLSPPFTASHASVLASLAIVAGTALNKHLAEIVTAFMVAIQDEEDEAVAVEIRKHLSELSLSLEEDGIDLLIPQLLDSLAGGAVSLRRTSASLLADLCRDLKGVAFDDEHIESLIDGLLRAFLDTDSGVLHGAWGALNALLTERVDNIPRCLRVTVDALEHVTADGEVPGLSMPDGIKPVMHLLVTNCLQQGGAAFDDYTKLVAMRGLGYLVRGCDEEALKKAALKITGPIIRVASESSGALKAESLDVANRVLRKIPLKLKTMLPQLQPTFLKALRDPRPEVRGKAVAGLGQMAPMQKRMDPVYTDLTSGLEAAEGAGRIVFLKAIAAVSVEGGAAAGEPTRRKVVDTLEPLLADPDEDVRESAGTALGCISRHVDDVARLVESIAAPSDDWAEQHGRACAVRDIVCSATDIGALPVGAVVASATAMLQSDNIGVQGGGLAVAAAVLAHPGGAAAGGPGTDVEKIVASVLSAPNASKDLFRAAGVAFSSVAMRRAELPDSFVSFAVGLLFATTKRKLGLVEVEVAIGRLLRMGRAEDGRGRYVSELPEADAAAFDSFCDQRVSRHEDALGATLW